MGIYDRIHLLCEEQNIKIGRFCADCGVSAGKLGDLKTGRKKTVTAPVALKIANYFGVSVAYLLGETDEKNPSGIPDGLIIPITTQKIPILGNIACGEPIYADEEFDHYVELGAEIHADFALRAKGDSMIGARIFDGDLVYIRKQSMVENGQIAAVLVGDEATLKRVYFDRENQEMTLYPENPAFPALHYRGEQLNDVRILGRAIVLQTDVK